MREFFALVAVLLVLSLVIEYFWWIVGALAAGLACFGVYAVISAIVEERRRRRKWHARIAAELAARADEQHRLTLQGDERGIYGEYPPRGPFDRPPNEWWRFFGL